jgi:hypothetical protein
MKFFGRGTFSGGGLAAVSLAALLASGCSSTRFSSMDSTQPAPLPAAPSGQVTSNQLPPPATPDSSQFPTAPQNTQMASLPPNGAAPAGSQDITASSVAGVWNVNVSGRNCKVATPQTKYGQGYRAGPLHCPPPIDGIKSWAVNGKQLVLYDQDGGTLARLYSSGAEKFDGQTSNGQPISLTR